MPQLWLNGRVNVSKQVPSNRMNYVEQVVSALIMALMDKIAPTFQLEQAQIFVAKPQSPQTETSFPFDCWIDCEADLYNHFSQYLERFWSNPDYRKYFINLSLSMEGQKPLELHH